MPKTKKPTLSHEEASNAAKALEVLFTTEYISKKDLYKANFIRGLFFSAGSIIGAALILGFGVWVLSFFDSAPVVGPVIQNVKSSIEDTSK